MLDSVRSGHARVRQPDDSVCILLRHYDVFRGAASSVEKRAWTRALRTLGSRVTCHATSTPSERGTSDGSRDDKSRHVSFQCWNFTGFLRPQTSVRVTHLIPCKHNRAASSHWCQRNYWSKTCCVSCDDSIQSSFNRSLNDSALARTT